MSTTSGNMKSFKVTDKDGNVFIMTPVDTVAQQAIDEAKNLQFDEDFFTSAVSQDQKTVNVGLNGVPIGLEDPLKFVQDTPQGIVLGLQIGTGGIMNVPASSAPGIGGLEVELDGNSLTKGPNGVKVTNPVPSPSGVTDGYVLTKTTTNNTDSIVWAAAGGGGSLPAYSQSDANKVLAVNAQGTGLNWTTAGGGGGGSSEVEVIDFKCYIDGDDVKHLISASKTGDEALASLNGGKQLCARLCIVDEEDPTNIWAITTYPFSYLYYSEGIPMLFFNWGEGSGGGNVDGIIYNGGFERWEGPWYGDWN